MAQRKKPKLASRGLGDTVEKVIKATGLDAFVDGNDCGCDKRKEALNKLLPTRMSRLVKRCLTQQEYEEWSDYLTRRSLTKIEWSDVLMICRIYAGIFNIPYWQPKCTT